MSLRPLAVAAASLALCLSLAAGTAGAKERRSGARRTAAETKVPSGWKTVEADGGFSLAFPGEPRVTDQVFQSQAGPIQAKMYVFEGPGGTSAFMASHNSYPPGVLDPNPDVVLDGARDGAVANVRGTLKSEKKISVDGHPGRELVIEAVTQDASGKPMKMTTFARAYLVNGHLLQALVVMPEGSVELPKVRAFLESFRLTAAPSKPEAKPDEKPAPRRRR